MIEPISPEDDATFACSSLSAFNA
ncbi:hypothetical protein GQ600_4338 [Phytophthora cactorum]|nr:hypothetical protein GQ600_4338 [Phytophthora cactorum]